MGKKLNTSYARTGTKICRPTFSLKTKQTKPINKISRKAYCLLSHHYFLSHFVFDQTGVKPSLHVSFSCCLLQLLIVRFSVKIQPVLSSLKERYLSRAVACVIHGHHYRNRRGLFSVFSDYILSEIKPPGWRSYSPVR